MFGITKEQWDMMLKVFRQCQSQLQWIKLFGSRARGDYKQTSDVDLAVSSKKDMTTQLRLNLEQSNLPYTFDLIDYERQSNQKLKQAIDEEGKWIFATDAGGRAIMTEAQIQLKWEDFHRALQRLEAALSKEPDADDMYLDATIQRFEFTFELAWKLMKAVLDYEGIEVNSPRSSIREAWKQHLIADAEKWLDMQVKRNLSTHTYNEETAEEIYQQIKGQYIFLLKDFDATMQKRLQDEL